MDIKINRIHSKKNLEHAFSIRRVVFCKEQKVSEEIEMDEFDDKSTHILAYIDNKPIGTARWRLTEDGTKMERFAVLKEYRGKGVGEALVKYTLKELKDCDFIYLYAQEIVIGFYEKFGFVAIGNRFYEANIPHKKMILK